MHLDLKHLIPNKDAREKGSMHPAAAQEAKAAWEARQGGTSPWQSPSALRAGAGFGAALCRGTALNGSAGMEVPSRRMHLQPSKREGMKEYAHKCGHTAAGRPRQMLLVCLPPPTLLSQIYHRSTACPLPDGTSHADKKSLVLTLARLQPALLRWELATSHVSPGTAPQQIASLGAPQTLELCC